MAVRIRTPVAVLVLLIPVVIGLDCAMDSLAVVPVACDLADDAEGNKGGGSIGSFPV